MSFKRIKNHAISPLTDMMAKGLRSYAKGGIWTTAAVGMG